MGEVVSLRPPISAEECRSFMEQFDAHAEAADRRGDHDAADIANRAARYWEGRLFAARPKRPEPTMTVSLGAFGPVVAVSPSLNLKEG